MHNIGDVLQIRFLWDDVHQRFFTTILKGNMFVIVFQTPKQSKQIQEKKVRNQAGSCISRFLGVMESI